MQAFFCGFRWVEYGELAPLDGLSWWIGTSSASENEFTVGGQFEEGAVGEIGGRAP